MMATKTLKRTLLLLALATATPALADVAVSYSFEKQQNADDSGVYAATLQGDARIVTMTDGNHALFTGVDNGYLHLGKAIGNDVVGKLDGDFTIAVDVMVRSEDNSLDQDGNFVWTFASQSPNGNPANYIMLRVRNGAFGYTMRYFTTNYRLGESKSISTGEWHNITYVHSGDRAQLFLDGEVVEEKTYSQGGGWWSESYISPAMMYEQAGSLDHNYIGRSSWSGNTCLQNAFVDNLFITDRALSAEEVGERWASIAQASAESTEADIDDPTKAYDYRTHDGIVTLIENVNRAWQERMGWNTKSFWNWAVYHTGNMAAWKYTGIEDFRNFSLSWGERNRWYGSEGDDPAQWKYTYGESSNYALFGDWQCCFQTYLDLFFAQQEENGDDADADSTMVRRAIEVMDYMMRSDTVDYWWWADALYMAMPVMPKMYRLTGNEAYLEKMLQCFNYSRDLMYDEENHLFFRDARYVYPDHQTTRGLPDFWSRGDGWVVAGLAKVLDETPDSWTAYSVFRDVYRDMCDKVITCQMAEGFWPESLCDSLFATCRESSGTCLFTYGLLWGINHGVLPEEKFMPAVDRAWDYLTQIALQRNWTVGYMQPIGAAANENARLYPSNITDFGTGAFLLAATEMGRYIDRKANEETGITAAPASSPAEKSSAPRVYDLSGRRLKADTQSLQPGIYIIGNKKTYVRPAR